MTSRQGVLRPDVGPQDHQDGSPEAPVTLVEYGDFQCPFCYRAHPIIMTLQKQLGAQLRFVFRNFPIAEVHPNAQHAAEAAESVNAHAGPEAYWRMHHAIFEHQQDSPDALDDAHLVRYAASSGVDSAQVASDLKSGTFSETVKADFSSGVRSGVNGTPTFFINGTRFDGNWTNRGEFADALSRAAGVVLAEA